MEIACVDGAVIAAQEALIPATDDGLLRGDGVFEVMRCYGGRPFAVDEHLARLERSAANLRLPVEVAAVREDVGSLLAAVPDHEGLVRVLVTRGGHRLAVTEPLPQLPDAMRLATVTFAPTRILDGIKSLSYAGNMLATRLAQERGFDEALLVTPHGRVLEAPTSSFFWVRAGELLTPPLSDHILASITRARLMELTGAREATCTLDDVAAADEAFLASTVREALPVTAVEEIELPADGPLTQEAGRLLRERIAAELAPA
ncbi:MAG: aminotransferase class IV [Solirubrobacteraceae bacterium]